MMGFGLLFFLLVIGVVAYAGGWRPQFGPGAQSAGPTGRAGNNAMEILRERYARSEITGEEYQRMREDLKD